MDPMSRLDADMRRKGQEPLHPEPHAVLSLIQATARELTLEPQVVAARGKAPFNTPFNILTALYSLTGLLTVEEVAEIFGKSPDTIYRMAQKRQIPSFMFGGSRCFDPSELALWLIKKDPHLAVAARYFKEAA
jgi:excisionase family DNA binding protein